MTDRVVQSRVDQDLPTENSAIFRLENPSGSTQSNVAKFLFLSRNCFRNFSTGRGHSKESPAGRRIATWIMLRNQAASHRTEAHAADADDAQLLRRVAAQDKDALALLYREYHRRLARFLSRFTRRDDVIEEVINDTFMVAWKKAAEFRGDARVSTWLMGIAYRVTLRALRDGGLEHDSLPPDFDAHAFEPFVEHEQTDWVVKGLRRLSAEQRLVMELAYVMGHSLEEIAQITESSVSTVKARMFHARVKLRNVMPMLGGGKREE